MAKPSSTIKVNGLYQVRVRMCVVRLRFSVNSLPQSPQENSTFSSVSTSVYYQVILLRKCFSTVTARTWLMSSVNNNVFSHITPLSESSSTISRKKWSISGVSTRVPY